MTAELGELVRPVLAALLDLAADPRADRDAARAARLRDGFDRLARRFGPGRGTDEYLGLAYPVACLVDELLTAHPALGPAWTEQKLEAECYGTNDRAWRFWEQAEMARDRGPDDTELFLTCYGLGFRGEPPGGVNQSRKFAHAARETVLAVLRLPPELPADLPAPPAAGPLVGSERLRRASLAAALALGFGLALGLFTVLARSGR